MTPYPGQTTAIRSSRGSARLAAACLCLLAASTGCVQRRMTIRSNPPGALVYVDDYQIGTTPVSTDFIYYGTRKIRLVKDGFETLTLRQPFPLPWYEIFPLDFVTENLWPGEIRDERVVDLAMVPAASVPPEMVVARAEPQPQPRVVVPQPIPAPRPLALPAPLPQPSALQPPLQNAPTQGIPSLGMP
ncbi:MAG: PEGA domain-containing protein [Planctomycetia bacterium]|nr:PEGA domain-containing protein [Planctomycetia bacterium]